MVVSIGDLNCLDALLWFGGGEVAARKMDVVQSTISRVSRRVSRIFDLTLIKGDLGEWSLLGDQRLLLLEREVHQRFRWERDMPLRVEAQYYSGPLYAECLEGNYLLGNFNFLNVASPITLLRSSVIDAWIGCFPDVPDKDDEDLVSFSLTRLPTRLVVSPFHPLLKHGESVTLDDISRYPCLALPNGAFPEVQRILESHGLWNTPARMKRYNASLWEGQTSDQVTVGYATSFTINMFPTKMVPLPVDISLEVGDSLVVKRSFVKHPRFKILLGALQRHALRLASEYDDVRVCF